MQSAIYGTQQNQNPRAKNEVSFTSPKIIGSLHAIYSVAYWREYVGLS